MLVVTVTVLVAPHADIFNQSDEGFNVKVGGAPSCDTEKLAGNPNEFVTLNVPLRDDVLWLSGAVSLNTPLLMVSRVIHGGLFTVYDGMFVVTVTVLVAPDAEILVQFVEGDKEICGGAPTCDTLKLRVIPPPVTDTVPLLVAALGLTAAVSLNPPVTFVRDIHVGILTVYDTLVVTVTVLVPPDAEIPVHAVEGEIVSVADDWVELVPPTCSICKVSMDMPSHVTPRSSILSVKIMSVIISSAYNSCSLSARSNSRFIPLLLLSVIRKSGVVVIANAVMLLAIDAIRVAISINAIAFFIPNPPFTCAFSMHNYNLL